MEDCAVLLFEHEAHAVICLIRLTPVLRRTARPPDRARLRIASINAALATGTQPATGGAGLVVVEHKKVVEIVALVCAVAVASLRSEVETAIALES